MLHLSAVMPEKFGSLVEDLEKKVSGVVGIISLAFLSTTASTQTSYQNDDNMIPRELLIYRGPSRDSSSKQEQDFKRRCCEINDVVQTNDLHFILPCHMSLEASQAYSFT